MSLIDDAGKQKETSEDFIVNGKWVHLKKDLPLEDYFDVPALIRDIDRSNLNTHIPVLTRMVESWEFDGDPSDPVSYKKMHVFKEVYAMSDKVQRYIAECMGMTLGNSGRASSSV